MKYKWKYRKDIKHWFYVTAKDWYKNPTFEILKGNNGKYVLYYQDGILHEFKKLSNAKKVAEIIAKDA